MIFKCKMCGGNLNVKEGDKIITCDYCGIKQTLPRLQNENIINLYERANLFFRNNEYEKAEAMFETILNEDEREGEAYWSLVMCKYGVEYVEDPKTKKRIPTCNRTQIKPIFSDENYKKAIENSSEEQKEIYKSMAGEINEIQKNILKLSNKEKPYDIFICYKETDNKGNRTKDSVIAEKIYNYLKNEGFKVFFSRITLEDKIGTEYEPYIFSALNSAKIMLVVGTNKENYNAVWVKNEWSRYLALINEGKKKTLIPCYSDMDPYNLPEEFSNLQAQDMSKIGAISDLVRGIKKIIELYDSKDEKQNKKINSKTIIAIVLLITLLFIFMFFISSNKKSNKNDNNNNTTKSKISNDKSSNKTNNSKGDSKVNVNYEEAAKKQMANPEKGETIAVLHIKGYGDIKVKFFNDVAPKAVENFTTHAKEEYYNGVTFHRVINEFMIQGGDPEGTGMGGESIWKKDFEEELSDELVPYRGSLCMASRGLQNSPSLGSQFFITQAKYSEQMASMMKSYGYPEDLMNQYKTYGGYLSLYKQYTVFGQVYEGMDVVDKIAAVQTDANDKPLEDVVIESIDVSVVE